VADAGLERIGGDVQLCFASFVTRGLSL